MRPYAKKGLQFGRGGGEGVEANMTKMPTLDVDIDGDISATPVAQSLCGDVPPNFSSKNSRFYLRCVQGIFLLYWNFYK